MSTTTAAVAAPAREYRIDTGHSEVTFQVRHLLSKVSGRFLDFTGTIVFDEANPAAAKADLIIQTASISTGQGQRDEHLRSGDFFDVATFPTITFKSRQVLARGGNRYDVVGDLTVRDITREVVLPAEYVGTARDPWGHDKVGFEIELTLNRRDFGVTWNAALETGGFLVGDEVKVAIAVQAL